MKAPVSARVWLVAFSFALSGCWSIARSPRGYETLSKEMPRVSADCPRGVVLKLSDVGVSWTDGELGEEIRQALLHYGLFSRVYHPVVPRNPPDLVLEVRAYGDIDEAVVWGAIAAAATGWFLLLPAPVLPYFQAYELRIEAALKQRGQLLREFEIDAAVMVTSALFANPSKYAPKARRGAYREIAIELARELSGSLPAAGAPACQGGEQADARRTRRVR